MTTDAELNAVKHDLGELAKQLEDLAEVVEDLARNRPKTSSGTAAGRVAYRARQIANRNR